MAVRAKITEVTVPGTIGKTYDKATDTTTLNLRSEQMQSIVTDLLPYVQPTDAPTSAWGATAINGPQLTSAST
jgi:hypothetical protein